MQMTIYLTMGIYKSFLVAMVSFIQYTFFMAEKRTVFFFKRYFFSLVRASLSSAGSGVNVQFGVKRSGSLQLLLYPS